MHCKPIPPNTLTAIVGLLAEKVAGISETKLVDALQRYEPDGTPPVQPLLGKREVARLLSVSPWTVIRMADRGQLPSVMVGGQIRFPAEAVRRLASGAVHEGA